MPKQPKKYRQKARQKAPSRAKTHQAALSIDDREIGFVFAVPSGASVLAAINDGVAGELALLNECVDALVIDGVEYPNPSHAPYDAIRAILQHIVTGGVTGE